MNAQAHLMEQYNKLNYEHSELHKEVEKYKFNTTQLKELKLKKLAVKDKLTLVSEKLGIS